MTTPVRRGSWIVILPLAGIAAAYVALFFLPGHRAVVQLREEIRTKQEAVASAGMVRQSISHTQQEMEKAQAYVAACRKRIPDEKDIGSVLGHIHQEAEAAGVRITRFDPQTPVVHEKLSRVPLIVGCSGSFSQIYEFIRKLETMSTSMWVGGVRIEKDVKVAKNVHGEVSLAIFAGNSENSDYTRRSD